MKLYWSFFSIWIAVVAVVVFVLMDNFHAAAWALIAACNALGSYLKDVYIDRLQRGRS